MSWHDDAACKGMALDHGRQEHPFYPGQGGQMTHIKAVCRGCPVRQQCLDYALDNFELYGIWGGLSTDERLRIRKASAA